MMIKRKVDDRVKALIDDVAHKKHRGLVLLVGDRAKDQIVNFHLMVSRANHNAKVSVLWCMKEDPDFGSTSRKKQERRARLEVKGGLATEATKEAFQTFLAQTQIRFCKYKETHKILGQTFGMAVLQDFEAITPNTLARTIETVQGGGLVIIMFRAMRSLRQLYTIAMDVHARYRTASHKEVVPRFNERFLLSLTDCDTALCVDDDLNVLPITQKMKTYSTRSRRREEASAYNADLAVQGRLQHEADLLSLKEKLRPSSVVGPLAQLCQTMDQAKTVLTLMQTITDKTLDATCVVTAGRGRGKSAALGIAAAGAITQGYSNIFCTAPTPENLQTFFEFAVKGLKEMGYVERTDFEALQSTHEEFHKCLIRINVFREHRQTIQFVSATDAEKFAQAELVVIDEAAALPLTLVKRMIGPYLIFLASTVSGYEGTGRSLSMKLVADMRKRSGRSGGGSSAANGAGAGAGSADNRLLKEITLRDPIRYGPDDPVERWMNRLLCLDITDTAAPLRSSPHPNTCELYHVNRDGLFSYHPLAEELLQRIQSLLVAAHYKNQPNDLQLLSDAPGHHLFVLCSGTLEDDGVTTTAAGTGKEWGDGAAVAAAVPDVYCVVHACEEGQVSPEAIRSNMSHGLRPSGDLIPYTLSQYYLEEGFAKLAGMRVVRIAAHPELLRAGYGSRALELLQRYYTGAISLDVATKPPPPPPARETPEEDHGAVEPAPRTAGSLLTPLHERPYEPLDYLGVSFGVTTELFNFWRRAGYEPLYIRQGANELTGEHSCVMVRPIGFSIDVLKKEFRARFLRLLAMPFRTLPTELALSILSSDVDVHDAKALSDRTDTSRAAAERIVLVDGYRQARWADVSAMLSPADVKRLRLFSRTFIEGGNVLDLVPALAKAYFSHSLYRLPDGTEGVVLSHAQSAVLLAVGLQCETLERLASQSAFAGVPVQQLRSFFQKALSRLVDHLVKLRELDGDADASVPSSAAERVGEGAKRPRETGQVGEEEEVQEIKDAQGNVVRLSVAKKVRKTVSADTTLLRDARSTVVSGVNKEAQRSLQDLFYRPKKGSKKHK